MSKEMSGRVAAHKNPYLLRYTELEKFLKEMSKNPKVLGKIEGYKEIITAMKEAKDVFGNLLPDRNRDVVDYKQYAYYLAEKTKNVTDVMKKYNVTEQMKNFLGDNKDKEIHYPLANGKQEFEFRAKFGDSLKVDFNNPDAVLERLCMHLRDVSETIDSFQQDLQEDIREANENIREEYEKWKGMVDRYKDPNDPEVSQDLVKNGVTWKPEIVEMAHRNHEIDLDNMRQYKEALENEERFIKEAKSIAAVDYDEENKVSLPYDRILNENKVNNKDHVDITEIRKANREKREEAERERINQENIKQEDAAAEKEAAPDYPENEEFKMIAKDLEEAKTFVNSSQYNDICKIFKALADPKKSADLTDTAKKALYAKAGKTINDYISHKAKDGVKPNVFKKLAAVEAASRCIERRLKPFADQTAKISDKETVAVNDIKLSIDDKVKNLRENQRELYQQFQKEKLPGKNKSCTDMIKDVQDKKLKNVMTLSHGCMNKIIASALEQGGNVYELNKSRIQFADEQFAKNAFAPKAPESASLHDAPKQL